MASFSYNSPQVANPIVSDVDNIREIQKIQAKFDPSLAVDAPEGAKRLVVVDGGVQFQSLSGLAWNSVGKLMHDVDSLDGFHAVTNAVANSIPVYNASAQLVGDLTGNANTATTLRNSRKFQVAGIASSSAVNFNGASDVNLNITSITINNEDDSAINGVLTISHGGTGASSAEEARVALDVAKTSHTSTTGANGKATSATYGHTIISDTLANAYSADAGYAFSPKGAYQLDQDLRTLISGVESSSASSISSLDTNLRALITQEFTKANTAASNAQTTANTAVANASTAQTTANAAQTAANTAQTTANAKVAKVNNVAPDSSGNVTLNIQPFPSGTKMLFNQASAPSGWTKQTSVDNAALRVVSGSGGGTGGSIAFSTLFATGKAVSLSGNVGATTLTAAQMPSHRHTFPHTSSLYYTTVGAEAFYTIGWRPDGDTDKQYRDGMVNSLNTTGSSNSHTHTLAGTASIALNVKYTDVIICSKS